ncbi:MAG TPA: 4Fe-4S binding protein [Candidatus Bacteroides merdavium]|uniref:4Fe-4S binding protein n=1 Tax=Candidatus Bacteroides merdavium TaxID=2838472 RepID=A0A9D2KEJ5_9BACE|nr:4Fe-4S binding protein [Candidatus Bacteroides merdavium]
MTITEINLITFSPTCTSKQIGEAIVRGTGITGVNFVDLTLQTTEQKEFSSDALAVITVPVYGGHVAPLALERMKDLRADGTPVVIVVVYGNRAYEKALTELDAFVSGLGFKVIAGGTFVGEHSYSSDRYPIAAGRPDDDDLKFAEEFGAKVRTKLENAADAEHLYGVDVQKIQRPKQPFLPLLRFLRRVIKLRKNGVPMPRTPQVDENLCTHCGLCVKRCPAGAIVKGEECVTNAEKCIRCCACLKGCPQKARTFDTPFAALLHDCFQRPKENRIIL